MIKSALPIESGVSPGWWTAVRGLNRQGKPNTFIARTILSSHLNQDQMRRLQPFYPKTETASIGLPQSLDHRKDLVRNDRGIVNGFENNDVQCRRLNPVDKNRSPQPPWRFGIRVPIRLLQEAVETRRI